MPYVIASPCIDVNDKACIDECPVDCIYEGERKSYINPRECIDCGACEPVCPVEAISQDRRVPEDAAEFIEDNRAFFEGVLPGRRPPSARRAARASSGRSAWTRRWWPAGPADAGRPPAHRRAPARGPAAHAQAWQQWAHDFGDRSILGEVYDPGGTVRPAAFDDYLAAQGVDVALLMCEYSPKVTGIQPIEDVLPLARRNPARIKLIANVNPHLHYPAEEELERQLGLGAVA